MQELTIDLETSLGPVRQKLLSPLNVECACGHLTCVFRNFRELYTCPFELA
jgi:hypothetical protein